MSEEILQVKDLPEDEKNVILECFKNLHLSGSPLKMEVNAAKALIAKKEQENGTVQNGSIVDDVKDVSIKQEAQEEQKNVQPFEYVPELTGKKSDGKCIICHCLVYDGICSGCNTRYRG